MSDAAHPRIGHAERDRAVEELREAAALGRIDLDELDDRVERALAARTQQQLDSLLADLVPPPGPGGALVHGGSVASEMGHDPQDPLVLAAGAGTARRTGPWEVPGWIQLSPALGSVRIDCRDATTRYPVIEVEVLPSAGTAVLILPEGWAADVDRLGRGIGSVSSSVPTRPAARAPLLLMRGSVGLGTLKVRHANWWERWRARR